METGGVVFHVFASPLLLNSVGVAGCFLVLSPESEQLLSAVSS